MGGIVIQHIIEDALIAAIIDRGEHTEGAIIQFIGGHIAQKIRQGPVKEVRVHTRLRLFFPLLRPSFGSWQRAQRHGGLATGASWPAGRARRLDHQSHRQIDHAMGVVTAWWCQIGQIRIEVLATLRAVMLRIGDHEIPRTPEVEIAQVVQRPLRLLVPISHITTTRTRVPFVIAAVGPSSGWGRSAVAVIPSLGSGRYAPGPNRKVSYISRHTFPLRTRVWPLSIL